MSSQSAKKCVYCKKDGHVVDACPIVRCRRCDLTGHTERVCKNKERCEKCGKFGHSLDAECTKCRQHGHIASNCTIPKCAVEGCGKIGHRAEDCLSLLYCEECDRNGHTVDKCWFCERCQKRGHTTDACSLPECDKCGKIGHLGNVCWSCTFCSTKTRTIYGHRTEDCFAAKNHEKLLRQNDRLPGSKTNRLPFNAENEILIGSQKPIIHCTDATDDAPLVPEVKALRVSPSDPFVSFQKEKVC
jgi:hypothetical protein